MTTDKSGYYQHWFYYGGGYRAYQAEIAGSGTRSNLTRMSNTTSIATWNNYRPKVRYCQCTKLQGYYAAWAPVCPTTTFRMATRGSEVTSAAVTKKGSTVTAWMNSKIHAVAKDGYSSPLSGWSLYLQKWDGTKWAWQTTCKTSSTGYCNFGSKMPAGTVRVATGGSRVVSGTL